MAGIRQCNGVSVTMRIWPAPQLTPNSLRGPSQGRDPAHWPCSLPSWCCGCTWLGDSSRRGPLSQAAALSLFGTASVARTESLTPGSDSVPVARLNWVQVRIICCHCRPWPTRTQTQSPPSPASLYLSWSFWTTQWLCDSTWQPGPRRPIKAPFQAEFYLRFEL